MLYLEIIQLTPKMCEIAEKLAPKMCVKIQQRRLTISRAALLSNNDQLNIFHAKRRVQRCAII